MTNLNYIVYNRTIETKDYKILLNGLTNITNKIWARKFDEVASPAEIELLSQMDSVLVTLRKIVEENE